MQDVDKFLEILLNELKRAERSQHCFLLNRSYAEILKRKLTSKQRDTAAELVEALNQYVATHGDVESACEFMIDSLALKFFAWEIAKIEAARELSTRYVEDVLKPLDQNERIPTSASFTSTHNYVYYLSLAKHFPGTKPLQQLIQSDLEMVGALANYARQSGESQTLGSRHRLLDRSLMLVEKLPEQLRPKQFLLDLINEDLEFFDEMRSNEQGTVRWESAYSVAIAARLGMNKLQFFNKLEDLRRGGDSFRLKLKDGEVQFIESNESESNN